MSDTQEDVIINEYPMAQKIEESVRIAGKEDESKTNSDDHPNCRILNSLGELFLAVREVNCNSFKNNQLFIKDPS